MLQDYPPSWVKEQYSSINPNKDLESGGIRNRQHQPSPLFGIKPFPGIEPKKPIQPIDESEPCPKVGNYLWVLLCGWWLYLTYLIVGVCLFPAPGSRPYARITLKLAKYYLWPFSKKVVSHGSQNMAETEALFHHRESKTLTYAEQPITCGFGCFVWTASCCKQIMIYFKLFIKSKY
jgi:hypothetical protein